MLLNVSVENAFQFLRGSLGCCCCCFYNTMKWNKTITNIKSCRIKVVPTNCMFRSISMNLTNYHQQKWLWIKDLYQHIVLSAHISILPGPQEYGQASAYEKLGHATIARLVSKFRGYRRVKSRTPPTKQACGGVR